MSAPTEVLAYVQTLAWPAVAVTGFIMFRKPITNLIPRIREISAAGASVKFGEEVAKLSDKASSLAEGVIAKAPGSPQLPSPPRIVDPTMLFLEAYGQLESAAKDAAPTAGIKYPNPNPVQVIRRLAEQDLIPKDTVAVADTLRNIRNEVAHGVRPLEPVDAENLANTARSLALICLAAIPRSNSMV
ncbi:DUF4145 domain-containing protein [Trebonia sp.]|uniref:DUF4145 domain-containing protein n=1 Tax=Trebonia sp. TaxID=2767075 RepID=UPI0026262AA7|nr:DUF4145 domain-containing protein [Trebonia sp.]